MKNYNILIIFCFVLFIQPGLAVNKTNPDIGVNLLLLGKKTFSKEDKEHEEHKGHEHADHEDHAGHSHSSDGFSVQELEVFFISNIDPYWSSQIYLGIHSDQGSFGLDLEEAYMESLFIPNFTFKAGKFYPFLGRHNNLHTHYYPFIDPPLINEEIFGFHGWNGTGLSLAYLTPLSWYSEIILQAFYMPSLKLNSLSKLFGEEKHLEHKNPLATVLFFKNFWELPSNFNFELDLSYASGMNHLKHLFDVALVLRWESMENVKPQKVFWTTEWMKAMKDSQLGNIEGVSSYIQWQVLKNWWVEGRADYLLGKNWSDIEKQKYSFLFLFAPTEYSAIRLQYDTQVSDHGEWIHGVSIQSNVSLGVHPAHLY
ncbi:MAG: hypothetical protein GDA46_04335 [Bdellovibrionales bacterium]|nr:hypothetical protein [Bdellovibrionales bacterium]